MALTWRDARAILKAKNENRQQGNGLNAHAPYPGEIYFTTIGMKPTQYNMMIHQEVSISVLSLRGVLSAAACDVWDCSSCFLHRCLRNELSWEEAKNVFYFYLRGGCCHCIHFDVCMLQQSLSSKCFCDVVRDILKDTKQCPRGFQNFDKRRKSVPFRHWRKRRNSLSTYTKDRRHEIRKAFGEKLGHQKPVWMYS